MEKKQKHTGQQSEFSKEITEMISGTYVSWDKSKEQAWSELEKKMEEIPEKQVRIITRPLMRLAMAAAITLLVGISVFMQLYTRTINIPAGQHRDIYLPDNSRVYLNAQSTLSYKPLLWRFSRHIWFEGEAYFEVVKGKKFEVTSVVGKTIVLGTGFNINSRYNEYHVTCVAGKVKVVQRISKKEVLLQPGQKAEISSDGIIEVKSGVNTDQALSWLVNRFSFTSEPLSKVFEEIARQYGIKISVPADIDNIYTGTFRRSASVEHVLNLVCRPFSLEFTRKSEDEYFISRSKN
ncbi:MAG: FecR domain-containing protein [Bacteroidales bacterium]|nr:MAG: FecR domain-containing protein [Bacteroidales bacterium]